MATSTLADHTSSGFMRVTWSSPNEVVRVATGAATAGTFTLTFDGQTTAAIAYNATAAAVQSALEALSNIAPGDITVTGGPLPGSAVSVTFGGGVYKGVNVADMTGTGSLTGGTLSVTITTQGTRSLGWWGYRLYHRPVGQTAWTLIHETTSDTTTYLHDTYAWANTVSQEITLVEVTRNATTGALTEGTYADANTFTPATSDPNYWLVHPTNQNLTVQLRLVTDEDFNDEHEMHVMKLIGRGRKANLGDNYGRAGSLSCQLRDIPAGDTARTQRQALENLKREGSELFLRNPFGDLTKVVIEDLDFTRVAGLGVHEAVDVSLTYQEVS